MARRDKYSCVDPLNPRAAGVCDRGGEVRQHSDLIREMRWAGNRLVATGFLVCRQHLDPAHPHDRVLILRPDPVPIRDPRPMVDSIGEDSLTPDDVLDTDFILDESLLA